MKKVFLWITVTAVVILIGLGSIYAKNEWGTKKAEPAKAEHKKVGKPQSDVTQRKPQKTPVEEKQRNSFAIRGVIEGFYGTPWSNPQRIDMFDFMGRTHFNTYVFAPKDDPYQRREWMNLYPADKLQQMKTLVKAAEKNGIRFVYSVSPGLPIPLENQPTTTEIVRSSITYSSDADRGLLDSKIDQLRSIGVHTFMLSFDDVQTRLKSEDRKLYGTDYAKAQMDLANHLLRAQKKKDRDFALWFAPTVYYGVNDGPYWTTLRTNLDPSIQVIWTGSWVLSGAITSGQADTLAKWLGRKPLIWDNYPVNDYTYAVKHKPQLLLGPIRNRSADLGDHVTGLLSNPMIQPESSKIALYTIGQYLHDSRSYDPEKAWNDAIGQMDGIGDTDAFRKFCSYSRESFLTAGGNPAFTNLANAYLHQQDPKAKQAAADRLRRELRALSGLPARLRSTISNSRLLAEIMPWLAKLGQEGDAGMLAMDYLAAPEAQRAQKRQQLQAKLNELNRNSLLIGSEVIQFIRQALSR